MLAESAQPGWCIDYIFLHNRENRFMITYHMFMSGICKVMEISKIIKHSKQFSLIIGIILFCRCHTVGCICYSLQICRNKSVSWPSGLWSLCNWRSISPSSNVWSIDLEIKVLFCIIVLECSVIGNGVLNLSDGLLWCCNHKYSFIPFHTSLKGFIKSDTWE